ncbi:MAG TPA: peptidoglycan editing factor PgeF [Polyangiaceae bacterium]
MDPQPLTSPMLARAGFRHAFFGRLGGHSPKPFDSLHFGAAGHDAATLAANVAVAERWLGLAPSRLFVVTQVHGRDVVVLDGSEEHGAVLARTADAVVSAAPGVGCGVKVADCVPILLADVASGAVAAVHSGWQGTVANVAGAAVSALRRELGGDGKLMAAIGPHIESCCFEVGEDVAAKLQARAPGDDVVDCTRGPRPYVNLRAIVHRQLLDAGLTGDAVDDVAGCTRCDAHRFFSYRRDRETSGRQLAAIVARSA